jgi:hypothetical protein
VDGVLAAEADGGAGMTGVLVYVSGPITATEHGTVEEHVAAALRVYLALVTRGVPAVCPHLSALYPSAWALGWDTWMAYDCAVIDRCTHVLLVPGWETSRGARAEKAYAEQIGVRVLADWLEAVEALAVIG